MNSNDGSIRQLALSGWYRKLLSLQVSSNTPTSLEYKEVRRLLGTIFDNLDIKDLFILREVDHFLYTFMLPKLFAPYATRWSQFRDHVAKES
jgi:hypothetical protein